MAVLGLAAIAKLLDLPQFQRSIDSWTLVPVAVRPLLAFLIPLLELAVSGAWILGLRRQTMITVAFVMLLLFTGAFVVHWVTIAAPNCNCFGVVSRYMSDVESTRFILVRNAVLLSLSGFAMVVGRRKSTRDSDVNMTAGSDHSIATGPIASRGFTLLELLLVIAMIGILVSLIMPSFRSLRERTERTLVLSKLQGHAQAFTAYTADYKESWPYLTDPNATFSVLRSDDGGVVVRYWELYCWWHLPMSRITYRLSWRDERFRERKRDGIGASPFWYSPSFLADPAFFNPLARTGRNQWRATRVADVAFPSRKVLLGSSGYWERDTSDDKKIPSAFVDGSVDDFATSESNGWDPNGTGQWNPGGGFLSPTPGMVTLDGVRGRDRK